MNLTNYRNDETMDEKFSIYYDSLSNKEKLLYQKNLDNYTFTHQTVFPMVMSRPGKCEEVLSLLLNKKISDVKFVEGEKTINVVAGKRGIRLDVYAEDDDARYNIEMQVKPLDSPERRTRYYQSVIDAHIIREGIFFDKLKKTYIIFICMIDPFKLGLPKYTVKQTFEEDSSYIYDDGANKIFFNANAYDKYENEQIRNFLEYCATAIPKDNLTKEIHNEVEKIKNNEDWRHDVVTWEIKEAFRRQEEALRNKEEFEKAKQKIELEARLKGLLEGKLEGELEGKQKSKIKIAKNLLKLNISVEDIAKSTDLTKEEVLKLKD